jgi:hypothetical protein
LRYLKSGYNLILQVLVFSLGVIMSRNLFAHIVFLAILSLIPLSSSAIVIDDFKSPSSGHSAQAVAVGNQTNDTKATTTSIGGARKISAFVTSGPQRVTASQYISGDGFYSHSSDNGSAGMTQIVWDGQSSDPSITPKFDGLRMQGWIGVDFVNRSGFGDNASKFIIRRFERDSADGGDATIKIEVYDARNSQRKMSKSLTITSAQANTEFSILNDFRFQDFVSSGTIASTPYTEHFGHVGAIHMIITGTVALDLSFTKVETDGCPHISPVPPSSKLTNGANVFIRDNCFVCNGNDSKCKDCAGNIIPHSVTPGFMEMGGGSCNTGQFGVCKDGIWEVTTVSTDTTDPVCKCNRITNPTPETCDGLDNNCNDQVDEVFDVCNVRCGDGKSCLGCDGMPNSGKIFDACNVCDGNGKSCAGCDGVPNSGKTVDSCGICGGDGTSCTSGCEKTNIRETLFQLDAQAKEAEKVIIRASRELQKNPKAKKFLPALKKLLVDAHNLQVTNWVLSWTLPEIINSCQNDIVCFKSSNVERLNTYRTNAKSLLVLNDTVAKYLRQIGLAGRGKILERNGKAVYDHALELAAAVPETTTVCNG